MEQPVHIVGLTGGIASGKSTVASFLREVGIPVIDADMLGHFVLAPEGSAYEAVIETFGADILKENGEIDRQKLGEKIFDNKEKRSKLEAITHPAIAELSRKAFAMIAERGESLAIYEAALLVETGVYKSLAALIVVSCSLAAQLTRIVGRDGLSREAASTRIASQYPLQEKLKVADYVIENEDDLTKTRAATLKLGRELIERFAKRH